MNKRGGDIPSILFAIIVLFVTGFFLVILSMVALDLYEGFQDQIDVNSTINSTVADEFLTDVIADEQNMWDYVFLAIAIGYVMAMFILAFTTQANPIFYFLFVIMALLGLFVGVVVSNVWEEFADTPTLTDTITRFPITDALLNNFYPLFITLMIILTIIVLFGKRVFSESGGLPR